MKAPVLLACALAVAGCASQPRLALEDTGAAADPNAPLRVTAAETRFAGSAVSRPTLVVTVTNRTSADEAFGPANISIAANGRPVRVLSAAELAMQIRRDAEFRRYAAQTRAEIQAQVLEQDPVPLTKQTAIEARANGLQESAAATWAERRGIESLADVLVPTTLRPGETITRRVVLRREDVRSATTLEVHIQLGNADHTFTLRVNS